MQQRVSAKGKQIQQRRAKQVDGVIDSVRGDISPTSPPGDLSTLTRFPRGGPSSPLEDRMQSALAGFSSALGQPKRPSDGPDRGDTARQRTPAKDRVAKRASNEPDRDQDAGALAEPEQSTIAIESAMEDPGAFLTELLGEPGALAEEMKGAPTGSDDEETEGGLVPKVDGDGAAS